MKPVILCVVLLVCLSILSSSASAQAITRDADTMERAANALNEFLNMPQQGIPTSMIQNAQGIVIVPGMIKVGFVVGGRRGRGVAVIRDEQGVWRPPVLITMTGGSVGWQAGVQSTDVVLVFNTRNSVNNLLRGNFTIGVDAAAAAGPVGRQATAATDARLQAEIFSYSRSRGLFVGASVDGSAIKTEYGDTQAYYRNAGLTPDGAAIAPNAQLPPAAAQLLATLSATSGAAAVAPAVSAGPTTPAASSTGVMPPAGLAGIGPPPGAVAAEVADVSRDATTRLEALRQQLAQSARGLGGMLDESWREYLAIPEGVFSGVGLPSVASLRQSLQRFDAVASDAQYELLQRQRDFQQTHALLRAYLELVETLEPAAGVPAASALPASRPQVR